MAGRGVPSLLLLLRITGLLTATSTVLAQTETPSVTGCAAFQTSGIFQEHRLEVQLLLYTPRNPSCAELLYPHQPHSVRNSSYDASLDTKIIIHGFRVLGTKPSWTENMVEALLGTGAMNVVVVDWVTGSTAIYNQAVENVPKLSQELVVLIDRFREVGTTLGSLHIIGVSLGAHVAGHIGNHYGGRIGWITGLDPAAYKFTKTSLEDRLDPSDAVFVDAVHTDTDNFGIRIPVGHIDYYINGGRDQPGCPSIRRPYKYLICDHMRSVAVFINALRGTCAFLGFPCSSYQGFREGQCVDCQSPALSSCPQIGLEKANPLIIPEGDIVLSDFKPEWENNTNAIRYTSAESPREIQVYLMTSATEPYCAHHILLRFNLTAPSHGSISIDVHLTSADSIASKSRITIMKDAPEGHSLAVHGTPLCRVQTVAIQVTGSISRLWRKSPEFSGTLCMAELPLTNRRSMFCLRSSLFSSSGGRQVYDITEESDITCP